MKHWKTWKKYALVNLGAIFGAGVSLFIVPENTPLWIWATMACITVFLLNYLVIRRGSTEKLPAKKANTVIIVLGFVLLVIDVLLSHFMNQ